MTQQKSKKALKPANVSLNLQKRFLALSQKEQLGVTCFFNAHNTAHYIYDGLSEEAQSYVTYCINMSEEADKIDKKNSAQVS